MSLGATLGKQVGPMPLGAWLVVGAGGLFIAYKTRQAPDAPQVTGDALPTGGGYGGGGASAIGTYDGAAVVLSPVFQLPSPVVNVNVKTPTPVKLPNPVHTMPVPTPRVPSPVAPRPVTKPAPTTGRVVTYTVKKGDTLWSIAERYLGSGFKWTAIYAANKSVIDAAAKAHHAPGGGHWIYPGTTLRITTK